MPEMPTQRQSPRRVSSSAHVPGSSSEDTVVRLLDAAERLFAERGVDGVSLRTITQAAEVNVAAAHYYFGSKQGLIEAIFARRMGSVSEERSRMLDELDRAEFVDVRAIAEAFLRPLADMVIDPSDPRRHYVAFLAGTALRPGPARAAGFSSFDKQRKRFADLMGRALPGVPHEIRMFRFLVMLNAGILLLADLDFAKVSWNTAGVAIERTALVDEIVNTLAGVLAGEPTDAQLGTQ